MHKLAMAILYDGLDGKIEELKIQIALAETKEEAMDLSLKLAKLLAIKNEDMKYKVKPADVFNTLANFGAMAAVLKFEEFNVITSKLWGSVNKLFK